MKGIKKNIKYQDIRTEIQAIKKKHGDKNNIFVINEVDNKSEFFPRYNSKSKVSSSISMSVAHPLSYLSLSFSKEKYLEVRIVYKHTTLEAGDLNVIILFVEDGKDVAEDWNFSYGSRFSHFTEFEQNDPLNIEALKSLAKQLRLGAKLNSLESYENLLNRENSEVDFDKLNELVIDASSKYCEVYKIIRDIEALSTEGNAMAFISKVMSSKEMFDLYFSERFSFGVLTLGTYLFSILAKINEPERAREVYFKLTFYTDKQYQEYTANIVKRYRDIVSIKSSSIFSLEEYILLVQSDNLSGKIEKTIYGINLSAKHILENQFDDALRIIGEIEITDDKKISGEVTISMINLNNEIICSLKNNQSSISNSLLRFEEIKQKHPIFSINYNLILYLSNIEAKNSKYLDLTNLHENAMLKPFYKEFHQLHDAIIKRVPLMSDYNKELKQLNLQENKPYMEAIEAIINSNGSKSLEFHHVKTLLIDYNIWNYYDQ